MNGGMGFRAAFHQPSLLLNFEERGYNFKQNSRAVLTLGVAPSILIGFPIVNHPPFWGPPNLWTPHVDLLMINRHRYGT